MNVAPEALPGGPISHAIARLARIHQLLAGRLLRELGLHPSQELLLMRLWESGPQRQADLAAELGTDSAGTTRIVQRLEAAGYVNRRPDPNDRRASLVVSTPAGDALRTSVECIWAQLEELTVGDMSPSEQEVALASLLRLEENVLATEEGSRCGLPAARRGGAPVPKRG
ncbi:MarR family winged helix-turn-helix transcriptional regulator [Couchioplanes caeruleus]|uniref:MarR family winged helix-turn-helix transcriptional regulator n=1 Tax=Couchioplanes caeruleus TaxID=56438 RepID=UPI0020C05563|nr:MarR family winged helix-turn-helix transcriptional regulator [Couchioplanes caeruleus]UQU68101.1 MarR family winged helix-turn-helix transcriptional regulator [Couchioplanes caeruleus]